MTAKKTLRDALARFLLLAGVTSPQRWGRGRLSIVTFHRVLPEAERRRYPFPGLVVTPEELDDFLGYFGRHFDCGPLHVQHQRYMRSGPVNRPLLAITFDDAQHDNFAHARGTLARHDLKASFFVPVVAMEKAQLLWHDRLGFAVLSLLETGARDRLAKVLESAGLQGRGPSSLAENVVTEAKSLDPAARLRLVDALVDAAGGPVAPDFARLMTFDELRRLAADGHEVGSHSMTHCMMPECNDRELAYEVGESRRVLEARLGATIESFCYPNGDADARTADAVRKAGYGRAVTTAWGSNGKDADPYLLRRYDMDARRVTGSRGQFLQSLVALRMSGFGPRPA